MTYDEKFDLAIAKLEKMADKNPNMVWFSEAKFLYSLIPTLIDLLKLGKQFDIDKLTHKEDLDAHWEHIQFVNAIVGYKDA